MAKPKKPKSLKMLTEDGSPMVEVFKISLGDNGDLILDCKALDSMRMNILVSPEAIAEGWPVIMAGKKEIFSFAKRIPKALKEKKKVDREASVQPTSA